MSLDTPVETEPHHHQTTPPSMVTLTHRNSQHLSIFPPINHEGLHTSFHHPKSPSDSSISSASSSSDSLSSSTSISINSENIEGYADTFLLNDSIKDWKLHQDCINRFQKGVTRAEVFPYRWLGFGLEILRRKIRNVISLLPGCGAIVAAFRLFPVMSTLMVVYVGLRVLKWVRLRHSSQYTINALMGVIREKDEKIVKLLDQIAQLNQVLLGRQRSR